MILRPLMLFFAIVALLTFTGSASAQDPMQPASDPILQLRLTPEQRQRVRLIFEEKKEERQATGRRLREASLALEQALDVEPVDDALIEKRISELAAAQAAQLRMRIQTELRIRRELLPEQLAIWRRLRLQLRDFAGAERPLDQRRNQRQPRRNGLTPSRPSRNP